MSRAPHPTHDGALASSQPAQSLVTVHVATWSPWSLSMYTGGGAHATLAADPTSDPFRTQYTGAAPPRGGQAAGGCGHGEGTDRRTSRPILIRSADVDIGDGGESRCAVSVGGPRDTPASETPAPSGAALRPRSPSVSPCHERPSPALWKPRPARAPAYLSRQNESPGRPADSLPGESPRLRSAPPSHSGGMTERAGTLSRPIGAPYRLCHTSSMRRARVRHRSTLEAAPQPSWETYR